MKVLYKRDNINEHTECWSWDQDPYYREIQEEYEAEAYRLENPRDDALRPIHTITIRLTKNNTFITLTEITSKISTFEKATTILPSTSSGFSDLSGQTVRILSHTSGGVCGFKGKLKASPMANRTIGELAALKINKQGFNGYKHVSLILYGTDDRLEEIIKGLLEYGVSIVNIEQRTPLPHNGPRPKKKRRK